MYIVRRNSYNPVQNIFSSVFAGNNLKTNIEETDKEYLLTMLVPGVAKKDINIDYEDSYLIISVESKSETEDKVSYSRQFYNDAVTMYNNKIQLFPSNIIAGMFGFVEEELFASETDAKSAPKVQF